MKKLTRDLDWMEIEEGRVWSERLNEKMHEEELRRRWLWSICIGERKRKRRK